MSFGGSKRSGKSVFKVIHVSNKRSTSVANFPSCWSAPTSSKDGEEFSKMAQDDSAACMSQRGNEESDGEELSMPYQKRREQLCINGEALRVPLLQSSIRMESFIPLKYVGGDYDRDGQTWCWDCSFGAYYCIKCCNELHRLKQWFYSPPALKMSVFRIFKLTKLISKL